MPGSSESRQAANERLEALGDEHDLVIPLLIDMDNLRISGRSTCSVVKADHVVPSGRAVGEVDPNVWVAPFLYLEPAPDFAA